MEQEDYQLEKQRKLERFREMNKGAVLHQIVCAGSSLMEMFPVESFISKAKSGIIVYNRGVGGFVAKELLDNIDTCILDLKPYRLFINIGTNDLSDPRVSVRNLMDSYDEILVKVKEAIPDIEIYIMAYYPVNYEAAIPSMKECLRIRSNERIDEANLALQTLALKHGARYIDINANLKDKLGRLKWSYTIDGMHITEEGYLSVFDDFMRYASEPKWKK